MLEIARTFETEVHQVDNYEVSATAQSGPAGAAPGPARAGEADRNSKLFVLVITVGERKYGLIVDALEGEEELVIKALDDHTFSTDLVSGASILGDGRVVLILNLLGGGRARRAFASARDWPGGFGTCCSRTRTVCGLH